MTSGLPWGLALSSGVNTYLPLFLLALFARFGHIVHVSPRFQWLISDQAIFVLGVLAVTEILAQKFPVLDNVWDFAHTLLRPIAGAIAAGATLSTSNVFEIVAAMVMGGGLAAASHSAKSGLRLVSTSKSFGAANLVLSLGEDAGVVVASLLSVYAPWVMLAIVLLFVLVFALLGPRISRMLAYDVGIVGSALTWLVRWVFRRSVPSCLKESLLDIPADRLRLLAATLEPGEELLGALHGWRKRRGGPRRTWCLLTSRRLTWVEAPWLRKPRTQSLTYADISLARHRNLLLMSRVEVLTEGNETYSLTVAKGEMAYAQMAAKRVADLAAQARVVAPLRVPSKSHSDESKCKSVRARAAAECRGDVAGAGQTEQGDRQIAEGGHHLRACARADAGAIFIEGDVADPMQAILNRPLAATQTEQACGGGARGGQTAQAIHGFAPVFVGNEFGDLASEGENLRGVREVEVIAQGRAGPDGTDFHPAVPLIDGGVLRGEKLPASGRRCLGAGWVDYLWR
jgi:hypothetical protein